jgi:predicted Zn-dependent protease
MGGLFSEAQSAAGKARDLAGVGSASAAQKERAKRAFEKARAEREQARKNQKLLTRLIEARVPDPARPGKEQTDKQFEAAFREWGLDVRRAPAAEAAARLRTQPQAVLLEIIGGLDEWVDERRRRKLASEPLTSQLVELVAALDPDRDRRKLREVLGRAVWFPERIWLGKDREALVQMARDIDLRTAQAATPLLLARALREGGDGDKAEALLRMEIVQRRREAVLYHLLGDLLSEQRPPRHAEAVECYRAAWMLRPEFGLPLSQALQKCGRPGEAAAVLVQMVREAPGNSRLLIHLGQAQEDRGSQAEAEAAFRKAVRVSPEDPSGTFHLAWFLARRGRREEAEAVYRRLPPEFASQNTLADALFQNALKGRSASSPR